MEGHLEAEGGIGADVFLVPQENMVAIVLISIEHRDRALGNIRVRYPVDRIRSRLRKDIENDRAFILWECAGVEWDSGIDGRLYRGDTCVIQIYPRMAGFDRKRQCRMP